MRRRDLVPPHAFRVGRDCSDLTGLLLVRDQPDRPLSPLVSHVLAVAGGIGFALLAAWLAGWTGMVRW